MNQKKLNFKRCLIDPEDENSIKEAQEKYDEFNTKFTKKKYHTIIKYIVLMYDINSPIRDMYSKYSEKKRNAAMIAGFEMSKGRFKDDIDNILIGEDEHVNRMITRYIVMHNKPLLVAFNAYNEMLYHEMEKSLHLRDAKSLDLKYTRENVDKLTERLNEIYFDIFGGQESLKLKDQLYETMEIDRIKLRPESVAKSIREGDYEVGIDPYRIGELEYES